MNMETTLVYYTTFAGMQRETIFTVVSKLTTLSSVKISISAFTIGPMKNLCWAYAPSKVAQRGPSTTT